jgi:hypothetical protein
MLHSLDLVSTHSPPPPPHNFTADGFAKYSSITSHDVYHTCYLNAGTHGDFQLTAKANFNAKVPISTVQEKAVITKVFTTKGFRQYQKMQEVSAI